jgi:hypothetical protein
LFSSASIGLSIDPTYKCIRGKGEKGRGRKEGNWPEAHMSKQAVEEGVQVAAKSGKRGERKQA